MNSLYWWAMLAATALWGVSGGIVAGVGANGFVAAAVVETVTALALLAFARACKQDIKAVFRDIGLKRLLALGAIEAANVTLYYTALVIGPVGPVIAMHLTSPVLLIAYNVLRRGEKVTGWRIASVATLVGAIVAIALSRPASSGVSTFDALLAVTLSLLSALCIAVFVTWVWQLAPKNPSAASGGLQMLVSGGLVCGFLPVVLLVTPQAVTLTALWKLVAVGLVLFAPAVWFYWQALRGLDTVTATSVQLGEPLFGAVAVFLLFGMGITLVHAAAALFVLAAVFLELLHRKKERKRYQQV